jgi:hypothetical protein
MDGNAARGSEPTGTKISDMSARDLLHRSRDDPEHGESRSENENRKLRSFLALAQKQRESCREKLERGRVAVQRSGSMIVGLEEGLQKLSYIDNLVTEECIASIIRSIDDTEVDQLEFSSETRDVWSQKIELEKRLQAARKANELLVKQQEDMQNALEAAEAEVERAAVAVAALAIEPLAEELAGIEERADILRRLLLAYGALRHEGEYLPMSRKAATLLRGQKACYDPQVVAYWSSYLKNLSTNAEFSFAIKSFT